MGLKYSRWYYLEALSPDIQLHQFFDAPIITTDWNQNRKDENLVRFGYIWKCYDLVALKGLGFRPPILGTFTDPLPLGGYLIGVGSCTLFLVSTLGLEQPKAEGGCNKMERKPP